MRFRLTIAFVALCGWGAVSRPARAADRIELIAPAGTALRVAIDETIALTRVGQAVHGTLVEPLYAYDRIVLPAGARVAGHVAALEDPSRAARLRNWSNGRFSPNRRVAIVFDTVDRDDGPIALQALGVDGIVNVKRQVAADVRSRSPGDGDSDSVTDRAKGAVKNRVRDSIASAKERASDALSTIKSPGKMEKVKLFLIEQLPYHRQYLSKGTVYDAKLQAAVSFGTGDAATLADVGTLPAPSSVVRARLAATIDSASTARGTKIEAVVLQPVFSRDGALILPQGTRLTGEVTVAKPARRLHRNGQLRFLFESVDMPQRPATPLLASLHSIDVSADDRIAVDEEGGAAATNTATRFIAPSLAILALRGGVDHHDHLDPDGDGHIIQSGHPGALGAGGFLGLGMIGAVIGPIWRPVGLALSAVGVARTTYSNILGKGQEVRFVEDTPIELQLAPGPSPAP